MSKRKRREGEKRAGPGRALAQAPAPVRGRQRRLWILLGAAAVAATVLALTRFFPRGQPRLGLSRAEEEAARSHPLRAEALDLAEQVIRDYPSDANALLARGMVLYRHNLFAPAVESWQVCLELDSQLGAAYWCLGRHAFEEGDYEKTLELMRQALEYDPGTPEALLFIGKVQMHRGEMEEAIGTFRKYVQQSPGSSEGHFRLGQAYFHLNRTQEAIDCYRATLDIDPKSRNAYYGLSEAYRRLGQDEQARQHQQKYLSIAAGVEQSAREMRVGRDDEAAMRQSLAYACAVVGKVYAGYRDLPKAEEVFRRGAEVCAPDKECRELLAALYERQGKLEAALVPLLQLAELEPGNVDRRLKCAMIFGRLNRLDEAEKSLRQALEIAPGRPEVYAGLAQLFLQMGRDLPQARAWAEKAAQLQPTAVNYCVLGLACDRTGDRAAAVAAMGRAVGLDPDNLQYRRLLQQFSQPR